MHKLVLMEVCGIDLGGCFWGMWVGFGNVEYLHPCFAAGDSCGCVGKGIPYVEYMVCEVEVLLLGGEVQS